MSEIHQIERTLASVAMRPSTETARDALRFFIGCLGQRRYQRKDLIAQEFLALVPLLDYLLILHGVEGGALTLRCPDMQITLQPSYDVLNAEEDLSIPSLGVLAPLPADVPLTFIIRVNADMGNDKTVSQMLNALKLNLLKVQLEVKGSPQPTAQSDPTSAASDIVRAVRKIVESLGLAQDVVSKHATQLTENIRAWQAEDALVAWCLVCKQIRVIVSFISVERTVDPQQVEEIKKLLEKEDSNGYTLGVFLQEYATTDSAYWKQDDGTNVYKDIVLGKIVTKELEKARYWILK